MSTGLLAFFAILPILVALILMVPLRWPSTRAMPLAFLTGAVLAMSVWHLSGLRIGALFIPDPQKPVNGLRLNACNLRYALGGSPGRSAQCYF